MIQKATAAAPTSRKSMKVEALKGSEPYLDARSPARTHESPARNPATTAPGRGLRGAPAARLRRRSRERAAHRRRRRRRRGRTRSGRKWRPARGTGGAQLRAAEAPRRVRSQTIVEPSTTSTWTNAVRRRQSRQEQRDREAPVRSTSSRG